MRVNVLPACLHVYYIHTHKGQKTVVSHYVVKEFNPGSLQL